MRAHALEHKDVQTLKTSRSWNCALRTDQRRASRVPEEARRCRPGLSHHPGGSALPLPGVRSSANCDVSE
eukprot:4041330-Alexandrium_andersonii.AAC.1